MSENQKPPYRRPDKSAWPDGVRSVSTDEMDHLGLDAENRLYWDGKPVVTQSRFGLTTWQKIGVGVTVLSAALGGFYALLQIIDWFNAA